MGGNVRRSEGEEIERKGVTDAKKICNESLEMPKLVSKWKIR